MLGITGTGGAGKSSLTDELIRRFRLDQRDDLKIAVIAIDPSRRKTGGALLGDRIRMNAIDGSGGGSSCARWPRATRAARCRVAARVLVDLCKVAGLRPGHRRDARASARAMRRSCRSSTCRSM